MPYPHMIPATPLPRPQFPHLHEEAIPGNLLKFSTFDIIECITGEGRETGSVWSTAMAHSWHRVPWELRGGAEFTVGLSCWKRSSNLLVFKRCV